MGSSFHRKVEKGRKVPFDRLRVYAALREGDASSFACSEIHQVAVAHGEKRDNRH